uniref:Uncharacterized protein n=1 Tax=Strombidium inclinatum TaxID=197538 RepID=A0A7S3IQD6_9SPIT|mmetsp:Transcript_33611/g.51767  ORF Transcript_33611/g.51767 Transcript_33611/m.51767 type:complete len:240 (+) Transcript_33611:150-869(+)
MGALLFVPPMVSSLTLNFNENYGDEFSAHVVPEADFIGLLSNTLILIPSYILPLGFIILGVLAIIPLSILSPVAVYYLYNTFPDDPLSSALKQFSNSDFLQSVCDFGMDVLKFHIFSAFKHWEGGIAVSLGVVAAIIFGLLELLIRAEYSDVFLGYNILILGIFFIIGLLVGTYSVIQLVKTDDIQNFLLQYVPSWAQGLMSALPHSWYQWILIVIMSVVQFSDFVANDDSILGMILYL